MALNLNEHVYVNFRIQNHLNPNQFQEIRIPVHPSETIQSIKKRIEFMYKIPAEIQYLFYNNMPLLDYISLGHYNYNPKNFILISIIEPVKREVVNVEGFSSIQKQQFSLPNPQPNSASNLQQKPSFFQNTFSFAPKTTAQTNNNSSLTNDTSFFSNFSNNQNASLSKSQSNSSDTVLNGSQNINSSSSSSSLLAPPPNQSTRSHRATSNSTGTPQATQQPNTSDTFSDLLNWATSSIRKSIPTLKESFASFFQTSPDSSAPSNPTQPPITPSNSSPPVNIPSQLEQPKAKNSPANPTIKKTSTKEDFFSLFNFTSSPSSPTKPSPSVQISANTSTLDITSKELFFISPPPEGTKKNKTESRDSKQADTNPTDIRSSHPSIKPEDFVIPSREELFSKSSENLNKEQPLARSPILHQVQQQSILPPSSPDKKYMTWSPNRVKRDSLEKQILDFNVNYENEVNSTNEKTNTQDFMISKPPETRKHRGELKQKTSAFDLNKLVFDSSLVMPSLPIQSTPLPILSKSASVPNTININPSGNSLVDNGNLRKTSLPTSKLEEKESSQLKTPFSLVPNPASFPPVTVEEDSFTSSVESTPTSTPNFSRKVSSDNITLTSSTPLSPKKKRVSVTSFDFSKLELLTSKTEIQRDAANPRFCIAYGAGIEDKAPIMVAKTTYFTIESRDSQNKIRKNGGDKFQVLLHGPSLIQATIVDNYNGTYTVSYCPTVKGLYDVFVGVDGIQIIGSPFKIIISAGATHSYQCIASIDSILELTAGVPHTFFVQARDIYGNNKDVGGDKLQIQLTGTLENCVILIKDGENGTYACRLRVTKTGLYQLIVLINGNPILGSPFKVKVNPGPTFGPKCIASGLGLTQVILHDEAEFTIQARDEFGNNQTVGGDLFRALFKGPGSHPSQVINHQNGVYTVSYVIEEPGLHEIHVRLKEDHIQGSPFHIQVDSLSKAKFLQKQNSKLRLSFSGSPSIGSKKRTKLVLVQSLVRRWLARKHFAVLIHQYRLRSRVAKEILDSEKTYLDSLHILKETFVEPLRFRVNSKPILSAEEIGIIFSNIDFIYSINGELFNKLNQRISHWSPNQKLGDIFVEMAPALQYTYTQYVNNYDQALKTLTWCQERSSFISFLEKNSEHPRYGHLELGSLLICPVQRLPRYSLLLAELLRHTSHDSNDFPLLLQATEKIKDVTNFVNENKKNAENLQKILNVQNSIHGQVKSLFHLTRIFIDDETFNIDIKGKLEIRRVVLFNDIILLLKPKKSKNTKQSYQCKEILALETCSVQSQEGNAILLNSLTSSYTLIAKDKQTQIKWVNQFKQLIISRITEISEKEKNLIPIRRQSH